MTASRTHFVRLAGLASIICLHGTTGAVAAQGQSRSVSFRGITSDLTTARAQTSGMLGKCTTADWDRRKQICVWNLSPDYSGAIVFKDGALESADIRVARSGANQNQEVERFSGALLRQVQAAGGRECAVSKPAINPRIGTYNIYRKWCFSDAEIIVSDMSSTFFGASRAFQVNLKVNPSIVAARKQLVVAGPIEKEIASAIVAEAVAINPDVRRQPGVDTAYLQTHPILGDLWYSHVGIYNRRCSAVGSNRYNCSFRAAYSRTPQGLNNTFLGQLAGNRHTIVEKQHSNYVIERVGGIWRSPTAAAEFRASRTKALAAARAEDYQKSLRDYQDSARETEKKRNDCLKDAWDSQVMAFCF